MADKDTDVVGAEPTNKDLTDVVADSSTVAKDGKKEEQSSDSKMPWHEDKRFKEDLDALKLGKSVRDLLKANELEDVNDLKDLVESGAKVKGKKLDLDNLDEILTKAEKLDGYEKYWKQQEELRRRGIETPDQTIARMTRELEDRDARQSQKEQHDREAKEAKQSVLAYESEVRSQLSEMDDLAPEAKDIIAWSLGVGNKCNEIDIADRKAVRSLVKDGNKRFNDFVKTMKETGVKEYLAGKSSIPSVPSTSGTVATSQVDPPKGLKGMRSAFHEMLKGAK